MKVAKYRHDTQQGMVPDPGGIWMKAPEVEEAVRKDAVEIRQASIRNAERVRSLEHDMRTTLLRFVAALGNESDMWWHGLSEDKKEAIRGMQE